MRYARRSPSTGPTGFTMFAVGAVVMAYGFYKVSCSLHMLSQVRWRLCLSRCLPTLSHVQVGQGNAYRTGVKQEKQAARAALVPILQAEEDRR